MINQNIINDLKNKPDLTQENLQIIACAGSGKTDFISHRIAYIVAEEIAEPENIVAFTFTEKAAEELKFRIRSRIRDLIGHQPDIGDIYVGTIHSFCYELLKEFVPEYRAFDVLDEGKRFSFLSSIRNDLGLRDLEDFLVSIGMRKPYGTTKQAWIINTFIRGIDIVREEMLNSEDVSNSEAFVNAYNLYNQRLNERRFLDFSSMMALAVGFLDKDKNILSEVRKRFTYITVDEYQDVNLIQERLVNLMAGKKNNICVVGDDDQSIYQWRGSTVDNIINFKKRYPKVFTHHLHTNFRSADGIINLSNEMIKNNDPNRLKKSMKSSSKKSQHGDIYNIEFQEQDEEIQFIIERIQKLIGTEWTNKDGSKRGLAYSDIAILFRSVKYGARPYLDALEKAKIPYAVTNIGGLFEASEVDTIFSIFSYLGDFGKIWDWQSGTGFVPDENSIYLSAKSTFSLSNKRAFKKHFQELKESISGRISLQGTYGKILAILGVGMYDIHDDKNEVALYNLGRLSQAISDYEGTRTYCTPRDIKRFCWFIRNYAQNAYDAGSGDDRTLSINAVQVMTLHGTKGLGFPVVFMPYSVDKPFRQTHPGFLDASKFNFVRYQGSVEDERRLFYVGVTRAKKYLYITSCIDPGPHKRKKKPSQFLKELNKNYFIDKPIEDPIKRKKLKPQLSNEDYRFPTNYSEMSDYLRCEYDYKMRYIYGFNPILVQALGYGKQVHNILNILHKVAQETGKVPTDEEAAEILKEQFYLRYAAESQQDTLKRSAMRSVLRYIGMWREDFTLSVNTERNFEMDMDNALISGSIDLIKRENSDESILEVVDFKTGNEKRMDDELILQVQLYTIAAREALNLQVNKAYVHFLDAKKQARIEVLTTPKQLELASRTISDTITGITTRRFRRNPKNNKVCSRCDWSKFCPQKQ
ncbi:MAG: ATP-dependent helicase [Candidatus Marinimicrobia bacterium]|nr:ATP-dependent helicase [Candidatus Neomarinimicrobiota bacterium]